MTLRVPTAKVANVGMRKLSEPVAGQEGAGDAEGPCPRQAHDVVAPGAGIRSQINPGDIVAIAEVVATSIARNRSRAVLSERQLYEAALDRLSREIAVVQHSTETEAVRKSRPARQSPRRGAKAEAGAEGEGEGEEDLEADGDEHRRCADEGA